MTETITLTAEAEEAQLVAWHIAQLQALGYVVTVPRDSVRETVLPRIDAAPFVVTALEPPVV